jgi:hypothetical protein
MRDCERGRGKRRRERECDVNVEEEEEEDGGETRWQTHWTDFVSNWQAGQAELSAELTTGPASYDPGPAVRVDLRAASPMNPLIH